MSSASLAFPPDCDGRASGQPCVRSEYGASQLAYAVGRHENCPNLSVNPPHEPGSAGTPEVPPIGVSSMSVCRGAALRSGTAHHFLVWQMLKPAAERHGIWPLCDCMYWRDFSAWGLLMPDPVCASVLNCV